MPTKDHTTLIRQTYEGLPIVDADHDLTVLVRNEDIAGATKKDPERCALAKACVRQYGSTKVLFFRTCAYIDIPDANGTRRVERYMLTSEARKVVEGFDKGMRVRGERVLTLKKPTPGRTLDAGRDRDIQNQKRRKARRKAMLRGESVEEIKPRDTRPPLRASTMDAEVRNGQGMVQLIKRRRKKGA